jgi:hypothetical protein
MCAHETPTTNLEVSEVVLPCIFTWFDPKLFDTMVNIKGFIFLFTLVIGAMIKAKVLDETSIKLSHTVKDLNLLWVCRYWHTQYCMNLLRVGIFLSLETMNPKINLEKTIKAHFSRLRLIFFFAFMKANVELHQMTLHITINREVIYKYDHELV